MIFIIFFSFAASAPTRTLGRRKLVRNRFTIDTDIVFDGDLKQQDPASPQESDSKMLQQKDATDQHQQAELAGDTDRWVEEQFDLEEYEDQEEVKETDILSDEDDEFCQATRAPSSEADLEGPMTALSLEDAETEESESLQSPTGTPDDVNLCAMEEGATDHHLEDQNKTGEDEIWVRRDPSDSSPDCAT